MYMVFMYVNFLFIFGIKEENLGFKEIECEIK